MLVAAALLVGAVPAVAAPSDGWNGDGWYVIESYEARFTQISGGPVGDLATCKNSARELVRTAKELEFYYECVKLPTPPLADGTSDFIKMPSGAMYETGKVEP